MKPIPSPLAWVGSSQRQTYSKHIKSFGKRVEKLTQLMMKKILIFSIVFLFSCSTFKKEPEIVKMDGDFIELDGIKHQIYKSNNKVKFIIIPQRKTGKLIRQQINLKTQYANR
jgi:hypothetical protein